MPKVDAIFFDAYGTLFDVHAPAVALQSRLGPIAFDISKLWRQKQLEYSWTLSLRGRYRPFIDLTAEALDFALQTHGLAGETGLRARLLTDYRALKTYPEVLPALQRLQAAGVKLALLSNGDPDLLDDLVENAKLRDCLPRNISVAEIGVYKPDQRVYAHALQSFGIKDPARGAFISSNAWDAGGAGQAGMRVYWVNRSGQPVEYQLNETTTVVTDLSSLVSELI